MSVSGHFFIAAGSVPIPSVGTSITILFTLAIIFTASWMTFWVLVERSTAQRDLVLMTDWAREHGYRPRQYPQDRPPRPLDVALQRGLEVRLCFESSKMSLVRVESFGSTICATGVAAPAGMWNLLICQIHQDWPATGLRPVTAGKSILDLFSLTSFPLLGNSDRFIMLGTGSKAAAALSKSASRGLLPPDIGMLLHGPRLVLDFTQRPFDTVEFERMIAVAEQIIAHLPPPGGE